MRLYSKEKIDQVIDKYGVDKVSIGMRNDWFWTAENATNRKDWDILDDKYYRFGGIPGSYIDYPIARVETDEGELSINVYDEVDRTTFDRIYTLSRKLLNNEIKQLLPNDDD